MKEKKIIKAVMWPWLKKNENSTNGYKLESGSAFSSGYLPVTCCPILAPLLVPRARQSSQSSSFKTTFVLNSGDLNRPSSAVICWCALGRPQFTGYLVPLHHIWGAGWLAPYRSNRMFLCRLLCPWDNPLAEYLQGGGIAPGVQSHAD